MIELDNELKNNKEVDNKSFASELKDFSFETIKVVIISLIVIVGIRSFVMQPFFVSGKSMEPNFHDGDYLIIDEFSYRFNEPKRGDVIIFHYPNNPKEFYIKRIVCLPGEKIEIMDNIITIYNAENLSGFKLDEAYISSETQTIGNYVKELKNDEYYVLGDNRTASADSRVWGVLEEHFIVGRAWIRAWPFGDFSVFEEATY
jgi:signal peptidase I